MTVKEKLYTVDDLWAMEHDPAYEGRYFYLIDGMLFEDEMPGRTHGRLAIKLGRYLDEFVESHDLGEVTSETGYYPDEDTRDTLLLPDIAFQRSESVPQPEPAGYVQAMPDLAVEIVSPNDTLAKARRKAQVYLHNGTSLVWIVRPNQRGIDVCRAADDGGLQIDFVGQGDRLSGEDILPGFELEVSKIFAVIRD